MFRWWWHLHSWVVVWQRWQLFLHLRRLIIAIVIGLWIRLTAARAFRARLAVLSIRDQIPKEYTKPLIIKISYWVCKSLHHSGTHEVTRIAVSIPESSGFFVSGWSPGETLGQWNGSAPGFLAQDNRSLHETANQNKIFYLSPQSLSKWPTAEKKKPEDSGIKIARTEVPVFFPFFFFFFWGGGVIGCVK